MIETVIRYVLTHVPLVTFVLALIVAALTMKGKTSRAEHWLGYFLLFTVGADALWAGLFHVLWPQTAASFIGWQVSPFQFEVGVSDIALGLVGIAAFWRSLSFKAAITVYAVLFYIGVAYGHVHEMLVADNFSPGNFGMLLVLTVARIVILPILLWVACRSRSVSRQ